MNSFRHVEHAIAYEIERQADVLGAGGRVTQETRSWREAEGKSISMRSKETAHDYRYFPEPDLPPFVVAPETIEALKKEQPELPQARARRFVEALGLKLQDARVLTNEKEIADYFESVVAAGASAKAAANWIQTDVLRLLNERAGSLAALDLKPAQLAELIAMTERGEISYQAAKQVLPEMIARRAPAREVAKALDLLQVSDEGALLDAVKRVVARETKIVGDYRSGKEAALNALLGRVMKESGGKANPGMVRELLVRVLS
jgi:aspartyl-tRNA(Asn)/glutamyl-tRNA(Gln) amidotransferase subunit B